MQNNSSDGPSKRVEEANVEVFLKLLLSQIIFESYISNHLNVSSITFWDLDGLAHHPLLLHRHLEASLLGNFLAGLHGGEGTPSRHDGHTLRGESRLGGVATHLALNGAAVPLVEIFLDGALLRPLLEGAHLLLLWAAELTGLDVRDELLYILAEVVGHRDALRDSHVAGRLVATGLLVLAAVGLRGTVVRSGRVPLLLLLLHLRCPVTSRSLAGCPQHLVPLIRIPVI